MSTDGLARPLARVDELGAALLFVARALRAAVSAPLRQGRETLRVTTEVGLGTGVLAMFGGSLAILGFITLFAGLAQVAEVFGELDVAMTGRTDEVRALVGRVSELLRGLEEQKEDIVAALESTERLSAEIAVRGDEVSGGVASSRRCPTGWIRISSRMWPGSA